MRMHWKSYLQSRRPLNARVQITHIRFVSRPKVSLMFKHPGPGVSLRFENNHSRHGNQAKFKSEMSSRSYVWSVQTYLYYFARPLISSLSRNLAPLSRSNGFIERAAKLMDHLHHAPTFIISTKLTMKVGAGLDLIPCTLKILLKNTSLHPEYQRRLPTKIQNRST